MLASRGGAAWKEIRGHLKTAGWFGPGKAGASSAHLPPVPFMLLSTAVCLTTLLRCRHILVSCVQCKPLFNK